TAAAPADRWSVVDPQGVLRWRDDSSEIALFGVNYYAPFTVDHEGLKALGEDPRRTIERDVAHFQRLGLDAIRLHVFDRQISDLAGNLVASEHLDLFDYLVSCCRQRGIYTVLTPIAWWPYHVGSRGFSSRFTMPEMTSQPEARRAQETYLRQFLQHVNPYTSRAYKDEPAVVAIELINEPLYEPGTTVAQVRQYIDDLAAAVRSTGAPQPIFYNGWADMESAVGQSSIEGCTFGWYPTGLVSGGCLRGNYLSAVDDFPRMRLPGLAHKAKIVYEFDAADVPGRVMYPAMARAFRSGGAQIACQFQYDPLPLAAYNYGWQTHYLNLVYAPGKTLSFAIAAEAFRQTPRLSRFEAYPANTAFGPFRIDFPRDLSMMISDEAFLYSNDTDERPPDAERLLRIAGCGRSPLVAYDGTGAYFLDRLADGLWRLEVYPDAVWVSDPHAATSLQREVSRVIWATREMTVRLPNLGDNFRLRRLAPEEGPVTCATAGRFHVEPGAYVLARAGVELPAEVATEFYAPRPQYADPAAWLRVPDTWRQGFDVPVQATIASSDVMDVRFHWGDSSVIPLESAGRYVYQGRVPGAALSPGEFSARLEVQTTAGVQWFPPGAGPRRIRREPHRVWQADPATPAPPVHGTPGAAAEIVAGPALSLKSPGFAEDLAAGARVAALPAVAADYDTLVVRARSTEPATDRFELGLVQRGGAACGTDVPLWSDWHDAAIRLDELKPLWGTPAGTADVTQWNELSFVFGAWLYGPQSNQPHGFQVQRVSLAQGRRGWPVRVVAADAPLTIFRVDSRPIRVEGQADKHQLTVRGSRPGSQAFRVWTSGFAPAPSCLSFRQVAPEGLDHDRAALNVCRSVRIRARATAPDTDRLEVVLCERDSAPWGTVIEVSDRWQDIVVPLDQLRFFPHWAHPANRGGPQDRFHPENVESVNFCFGAWLFGDRAAQPHGIEVEEVALVPGQVGG
ncbi:MAG: cellulase family glycosylhydrolase, partial [Pirellulaceae bacterium]|nr:cellulase family glycosylhydrolase [Pirellulaceae bacterium]